MRALILLTALMAHCQVFAMPYVNLGDCKFLMPEGLHITSGSIRSAEVALTSAKDPSRRIVFKAFDGDPVEKSIGDFSVSILEEEKQEKYHYFKIAHQFGKDDPSIESVVLVVGDYSVQILGSDRDVWRTYLQGCD